MSSVSNPNTNHFVGVGNVQRPSTPNKQLSKAANVKGPINNLVLIGSEEGKDLGKDPMNSIPSNWKNRCREAVVTVAANGILNLPILGGSDNGEFAYLGYLQQHKIHYIKGKLEDEDLLLEVQGQKVVGYTQRDVVAWLNHCCRNGNPVTLRVTDAGTLTRDLRQYLNTRFLKGSADHDLQNTIRDNLYLRTVPCTTRPKRDGEVDGVDYTFLPLEEFLALERSGNLLESGIYEGNHYGTPKPPRENPLQSPLVRSVANGTPAYSQVPSLLPGAHPSSEGKRRRNRSNVEAMASKSVDPDTPQLSRTQQSSTSNLTPTNSNLITNISKDLSLLDLSGTPPELGPLSANWEKAYTENGEPYFIDHVTGTSQWLDPRLARVQKKSIEDCEDDELPYGWEKIDDPHFGTYYIDHINRKTQYENPVLQAKRAKDTDLPPLHLLHMSNGNSNAVFDGEAAAKRELPNSTHQDRQPNSENAPKSHVPSEAPSILQFTRNPAELQGSFITSTLVKSSRGFGFTIVGGDDEVEEFLQIKSVVPDGPAWQEGKLAQGDILVYVNDVCVLGYTHRDVVTMFQHIPVGEEVTLEVCRGYPLAFDLNDPNTEIVTTVAVTVNDNNGTNDPHRPPPPPPIPAGIYSGNDTGLDEREVEDENAFISHVGNGLLPNERQGTPDILDFYSRVHEGNNNVPEKLTVGIVKGLMGFGFTIADSAHGQKVKKILDRPRCKNLAEGDVLLEINGKDVRGLEHTQVVQFLKDCAQGLEATITVQRGGLSSPNKSKSKMLKSTKSLDEAIVPRKPEGGQQQEQRFANPPTTLKTYGGGASTLGAHRSKTPTTDLYSSQREKEYVPNRPKTPLVDTRNRPKTPTSGSINGSIRPKTPSSGVQSDHPDLTGNLNVIDTSGTSHLTGSETLSPGSLYGRNESYSTINDNWQLGRGSRNYNDSDRVQNASQMKHLNTTSGGGQYNDWAPEVKQSEEGYYGYHQIRGDGEGNASVPPSMKPHADKDHHFPVSQASDDVSGYNNFSASGPYGTNLGRVTVGPNSYAYDTSNNANFYPYNGIYGSGGGGGGGSGGGPGTTYESEFAGHGPPVNMRKQGTSFEREQPSPVMQMGRNASNWYNSQQDRNRSFSPTFTGMNHVPEYVETMVTLYKQETGFGFRIVGGTEEGSQVSIGHIVPGGAADLDGRLRSGDEITSVDNQSVLHTSHHHVVQLMSLAGNSGRVTLGIRRRIHGRETTRGKGLDSIYPYDVTVIRRENEGFGFVIISSVTRAGSTIGRIIENSPAERCSRLHVGDRILAVNGKDIMNLHHGDIVNFIKDSGLSVTLTIGPPQDDASSTTSASQKNSNMLVVNALAMPALGDFSDVHYSSSPCLSFGNHDASFASRREPSSYSVERVASEVGGGFRYGSKHPSQRYSSYSVNDAVGYSFGNSLQEEGAAEDEQYYAVELLRGTRGFGFSIRGGKEFQNMPLFVLRIADDGPAARDGRLRIGDQIVEINGINTKDMTHAEAIELIKQGGTSVRLLIKRGTSKVPPPYGTHATMPLDPKVAGVNQSQVTSPILAGSLPVPGGPGGHHPAHVSSMAHLAPALHNGPLGQSSPRVLMPMDRDPYYSQWEYERGPV